MCATYLSNVFAFLPIGDFKLLEYLPMLDSLILRAISFIHNISLFEELWIALGWKLAAEEETSRTVFYFFLNVVGSKGCPFCIATTDCLQEGSISCLNSLVLSQWHHHLVNGSQDNKVMWNIKETLKPGNWILCPLEGAVDYSVVIMGPWWCFITVLSSLTHWGEVVLTFDFSKS